MDKNIDHTIINVEQSIDNHFVNQLNETLQQIVANDSTTNFESYGGIGNSNNDRSHNDRSNNDRSHNDRNLIESSTKNQDQYTDIYNHVSAIIDNRDDNFKLLNGITEEFGSNDSPPIFESFYGGDNSPLSMSNNNSDDDMDTNNARIRYNNNNNDIAPFRIEDAQSNPFISTPEGGTLNENWSKRGKRYSPITIENKWVMGGSDISSSNGAESGGPIWVGMGEMGLGGAGEWDDENSLSTGHGWGGGIGGQSGMKKSFRVLGHIDVERSLGKYYDDISNKRVNELDILITYLKGQKNLYIHSEIISQQKLNLLLIPCLLITTAITIFAPFIQEYYWSGGFISGLNALTAFFITLANYLKLESSIQTFHITANQYDKLETALEFVSSKMLFIDSEDEKSAVVLNKIREMEKKISDIKEWNPLFIPEEVRQQFPIICNINIFSFIKRIELHKQNLISNLKDVKNEIRYILSKTGSGLGVGVDNASIVQRWKSRLEFLVGVKEKIKSEILLNKQVYTQIDEMFTKEIRRAHFGWWMCHLFGCMRSSPTFEHTGNPVIDDYLRVAFDR